ncbi:MAG: GNAT family N-acetyltransferase [Acidimicrobiia bacterium]
MIALRAATPDDIPAVLAFWDESTAEPSSTDDADGIATLLACAPDALVLAVDGAVASDNRIVGTVVAGWDGWRGSLYRLAVAPPYRRRGVATALVDEAERRLLALGVRRMHLIVGRAGGVEAEQFWLAVRYEPTDQVRMVKNLG